MSRPKDAAPPHCCPAFCRYYGSEFINRALLTYCREHQITFTRSRPWKKNDSAHVEQKNGAVVRQLVGYDRFTSHAAYAQLQRVYRLARLHVNFFQPVEKLVTKTRQGERTHRVYDRAQTPYQRLCATGVLPPETHRELSTRSTTRSTPCTCGGSSSGNWIGCGPSPPPIPTASPERSTPPPRFRPRVLEAPR